MRLSPPFSIGCAHIRQLFAARRLSAPYWMRLMPCTPVTPSARQYRQRYQGSNIMPLRVWATALAGFLVLAPGGNTPLIAQVKNPDIGAEQFVKLCGGGKLHRKNSGALSCAQVIGLGAATFANRPQQSKGCDNL